MCGGTAPTQSLLRNEDTKEKRKAEREGGRARKEGRQKGKREEKKAPALGLASDHRFPSSLIINKVGGTDRPGRQEADLAHWGPINFSVLY